MISNFITPPDMVETVLVIDATENQVKHCAEVCQGSSKAYNVYFYQSDMNDTAWLSKVVLKADVILQHEDSTVPILAPTKFGKAQAMFSPGEYFNK
jgi:hypothetical protein